MKFSALLMVGGLAMAPAAASAQGINDAHIAAIVVTANQVDVDAGKLAQRMAANAEVKRFAARMVADHEGVNKAAVELATRLKVTPEENDTSRALKAGGDKNLATLRTLRGAAFDKAYVDHEVAYHAQVLDALDKTLIPGATNAELKALLVKVRPAFVAHLEHAKGLQATLAGATKPARHTVKMEAMSFSPATLRVKSGDTIVWVNADVVEHTSTSDRFDSKMIPAGKSWAYTAKAKGTIPYVCTYHPTMKGTLEVR